MEIFPLKLNKCYNLLRKRAYLKKLTFNKITIMNRSDKITLDQIKNLFLSMQILLILLQMVKVSAATDNPFLMAVVSQDMLESTTELPYKSIQKQVSLTVRNDKQCISPYVLVLKSDFPQEAIVTINLQETPLVTASGCGRQTTIYPPALNGNGNGNGVVAPAYVSAVGGAPTDDTQWYKDWRYWAVIALIAAVLIYLYMRSKKGSGEEQPLVVEMSRYSNA